MARSSSSMDDKIGGLQKAAILLITLGPEKSALIFKHLKEDEILTEELIGMNVYNENSLVGNITEYREDNGNKNIRVNDKLIPFNENFISKIDKQNREIHFHDIGVFL